MSIRKIFTTLCALAGMTIMTAGAQNYITTPMSVTPANNSVGEMFGQVKITWPGVTLEMANRDKDALPAEYNYIDPSMVEIIANGEAVTLNNTQTGGRVYTKVIQASNEQSGGGLGELEDYLFIDFPAEFPNSYIFWKGMVNINIKAGTVKTTGGEENAPIELTYYFMEADGTISWTPEDGSTFNEGNCLISATWATSSNLVINEKVTPFVQKENDEGQYEDQISAANAMKVADGTLQFDFSNLEPGNYSLTLPEGAVFIGDDYINTEAYYNFTILGEGVINPNCYIKVSPSEYDWFDGLSVSWGETPNAPYTITSQWAQYDKNSGYYVLDDAGTALFSVKRNGTDEIPIRQISIVEYQETEYSENYPNAQLMITLYGFQADVDSRYTLTILPGAVTLEAPDGATAKNKEESFTFTLKSSQAHHLPDPTVTPEAGTVDELSSVTIGWQAENGVYDLINFLSGAPQPTVTFNGAPFDAFSVAATWSSPEAVTEGADGDQLLVSFNGELQDGEYVVSIPANYVIVSDVDNGSLYNEAVEVIYTLDADSGVITIGVNGESYKVYNMNGVKVLEGGSASDLKNLPAGIYIVNGKKVVLGV